MGKLPKLTRILRTVGDAPQKTLHKYSLHFVLLQRISWQTVCIYTDIYYIAMYTVSKEYYIFPLKSSSSLRICQTEKTRSSTYCGFTVAATAYGKWCSYLI